MARGRSGEIYTLCIKRESLTLTYNATEIRKLANSNELEVEDIIGASFLREECIARELESLSSQCHWPDENYQDGKHGVPFGKWVKFACIFIRHGYQGLVESYNDSSDFSLSFLETYKTPESVEAVYAISQKMGDSASAEEQHSVAKAINLLLSFKGSPSLGEDTIENLRILLHSYLTPGLDDTVKAVIYCALRGVGDLDSIDLIKGQAPLNEPWATTAKVAINSIKKRVMRVEA